MKISLPRNFIARPYQMPFFEAMDRDGMKRAVLVWHRRAGKDKVGLNFTIDRMVERVGTYFYIYETFAQGRKALWDERDAEGMRYIDHFPPELIQAKSEAEMRIEFVNGSAWQVVGSDDIDRLRSTNPVGCLFSEYSYQNPAAWTTVRPILLQNGGWAVFVYTPHGDNHGKTLLDMARANPQNWFSSFLTIADTRKEDGSPIVTEADIERERAEGMDEDMIQQEYFCSFSSGASGAYYLSLMEKLLLTGHIGRVPWDPRLPVHTYWDLGRTDSTAIWFVQCLPREYRLIDYYENSGQDLAHYIKIIKSKDYDYRVHGAPHDIVVTEWTAQDSRINIARGLGVNFSVVAKLSIEEGHNAVRSVLPMCYFDADACRVGIEHLRSYKKKWNRHLQIFEDDPVGDQHIHGADAFRYFAVDATRLKGAMDVSSKVHVRTGVGWIDQQQPRRMPRYMGGGDSYAR